MWRWSCEISGLSTTLDETSRWAKSERAGEQLRYSGTSDGEIQAGKIMRQRVEKLSRELKDASERKAATDAPSTPA